MVDMGLLDFAYDVWAECFSNQRVPWEELETSNFVELASVLILVLLSLSLIFENVFSVKLRFCQTQRNHWGSKF